MTEEWERYRREQAAKWLEHVRKLGERAETLRMEIDAERDAASGLQAVRYDGMPHAKGVASDAVPDAVSRIQERVADYVAELSRYESERFEAHAALAEMSDEAGHRALTMHYLLGRSWEQCCVEMGYTYDGMMSVRKRALCEAYGLMPCRWRDPMERAV